MWIAFYLFSYTGLGLLMRSRLTEFRASAWLDGMIGATAIAAVATAIVFDAVLGAVGGSKWAVATNLTYPLADGVLIALVVVGARRERLGSRPRLGDDRDRVRGLRRSRTASTCTRRPTARTYAGRWVDVGWPLGDAARRVRGLHARPPPSRRSGSTAAPPSSSPSCSGSGLRASSSTTTSTG